MTDLKVLDQYAFAPFPPGYPATQRTFYSPIDNVHGVLKAVISSATRSLIIAMYAFDDGELAAIIKEKLIAENVYVQLTLDFSQAQGGHEHAIFAAESYPASSVAIGLSEKGSIMHLKEGIIDGTIVFSGSTNWSSSGEHFQDNQLDVEINPLRAAIATARIGAIHANMLQKVRKV